MSAKFQVPHELPNCEDVFGITFKRMSRSNSTSKRISTEKAHPDHFYFIVQCHPEQLINQRLLVRCSIEAS